MNFLILPISSRSLTFFMTQRTWKRGHRKCCLKIFQPQAWHVKIPYFLAMFSKLPKGILQRQCYAHSRCSMASSTHSGLGKWILKTMKRAPGPSLSELVTLLLLLQISTMEVSWKAPYKYGRWNEDLSEEIPCPVGTKQHIIQSCISWLICLLAEYCICILPDH